MTEIHFTVTAAFDRSFFWKRGSSVRYLVARLNARSEDNPCKDGRAPLNVALAIDASGSMGGGKLAAAKSAALGFAERLTERDRLTVVSFASDVRVHLDAVPVTAENAMRIRAEISRLQTRDTTFLSGGWFAGVDCTARVAEEDPGMSPRVIILSDGHANNGITDAAELGEHAEELRMRGVLTSALGIGDGYDEQLLRSIAEHGGGRLHDAEMVDEISLVLLGELDDIFETVVEDAQIKLTAPKGVKVEVLGKGYARVANGGALVFIGPVQNRVEQFAVFKVTCPKARRGDELKFELAVDGSAASDRLISKSDAATIRLTAANGTANGSQPRDGEIAEIAARIWSADIVANAARMNRDHAFEKAETYVKRELRYFRRYVEGLDHEREMIQEIELLSRRVGDLLSSRMHKEMTFQSSLEIQERIDHRGSDKVSWSRRMERGD
ncbi:MAG: VWA domain-containing protein [Roseovarius sp.]|nr:VWA domain-containing protein [Roseovarius sp.]